MAITVAIGDIRSASTNYQLVNSTGAPVAGGAATAAATTPFSIRRGWTLQKPPVNAIWGGGPPFRSGRGLAYKSYDNVVEKIPINVVGSSHENAVSRLQDIKRAMQSPYRCVLTVTPTGSSTPMYANVLMGDIQEVREAESEFEAWEGWPAFDAEIVLVRSPFFGAITPEATALNPTTYTNSGASGLDANLIANSPSGDLINEGQPLNIKILPANTSGNSVGRLWLASLATNPAYSTTGSGAHSSASTTGSNFAIANLDLTVAQATNGVMPRIMARLSTSANAQVWVTAGFNVSGQAALWTSRKITFSTGTTIVDFGTFSPALLRRAQGLTSPILDGMLMWWRSTDGLSATVTLSSVEYLQYYDMCRVDPNPAMLADGTRFFLFDSFVDTSGNDPCLPYEDAGPRCLMFNGSTPAGSNVIYGTTPQLYTGALLWAQWLDGSLVHTTTRTASITAKQAPLWLTLRGAD